MVLQPGEGLRRQRRAGGAEAAQALEIGRLGGLDAGLLAGRKKGRPGAEEIDPRLAHKAPQGVEVRHAGVAVEQADRAAQQQAADLEVPHHPAGGGKPVEAVAGVEVEMEIERLEVFEHHAALAMHDGLGQAGGAGGVDHPQRMVEGHVFGVQRRLAGGGGGPVDAVVECGSRRGRVDGRQQHQLLYARQRRQQLAEQGAPVVRLAAVAVAIHGDHHLGFDLREAVHHCHLAHVRRAHRPHRAEAGDGEEGHHRLGQVGHEGAHPVAGLHAEAAQGGGQGADLALKLGPGQLALLARFVAEDDGRMRVGGMAEHLFHIVQAHAGEPGCAGHARVGQGALGRAGGADVEVVPERAPEGVDVGHRPLPQGVVVGKAQAALARQPVHEGGDLGLADGLGGGLPDGGGVFHASLLVSGRAGASPRAGGWPSVRWGQCEVSGRPMPPTGCVWSRACGRAIPRAAGRRTPPHGR